MCVSDFSSEKIRYGRSTLSFYFIFLKFYIEVIEIASNFDHFQVFILFYKNNKKKNV